MNPNSSFEDRLFWGFITLLTIACTAGLSSMVADGLREEGVYTTDSGAIALGVGFVTLVAGLLAALVVVVIASYIVGFLITDVPHAIQKLRGDR